MTQEDIDSTQAPLIEHLIELRQRLIYCLIGFVGAFGVSFIFAGKIYNALVMPFFWALGKDYNLELIYTSLPEKFFTEVGKVWARSDSEPAQEFTQLAYPAFQISQETVALTDAWLAEDGHPASLRRLVAEGRDGVLRALQARAKDAGAA